MDTDMDVLYESKSVSGKEISWNVWCQEIAQVLSRTIIVCSNGRYDETKWRRRSIKRGHSYSERKTLFESTITPCLSKIIALIVTLSLFCLFLLLLLITLTFSTYTKFNFRPFVLVSVTKDDRVEVNLISLSKREL